MKSFKVDQKYDGKKLNSVLLKEFNGLSINSIYKALRKKDIKINNIRISQNEIVHFGDVVDVYITDDLLFPNFINSVSNCNIEILYEDNNILAVSKPIGIEVVGDYSLTSILSNQLGYSVFPCHRLDRNTSGITLFAKNQETLNIIFSKFKDREIEKHYICKVYGLFMKKHDILNDYLFKDSKKSVVYISHSLKKGYQNITTEYTVLNDSKSENYSILDVILHTGRTHQIRAHLAYIGHPIIGDR